VFRKHVPTRHNLNLTVPESDDGPPQHFLSLTPLWPGDAQGKCTTPDSFRPSQSPLAADLPAPGTHTSQRKRHDKTNIRNTHYRCLIVPIRATGSQGWAQLLRPQAATGFQRLSRIPTGHFEPRGSRAQYGPLRATHTGSALRTARYAVKPLTVGVGQNPPGAAGAEPGFQRPGAELFRRESPERPSFFSRILVGRKRAGQITRDQRRGQTG